MPAGKAGRHFLFHWRFSGLKPEKGTLWRAGGGFRGVHHHHVQADALDVLPGDLQVIVPAQQAEQVPPPVQHHPLQLGADLVKAHIVDAAQVFAGFELDHVLAFQIVERHGGHLSLDCETLRPAQCLVQYMTQGAICSPAAGDSGRIFVYNGRVMF